MVSWKRLLIVPNVMRLQRLRPKEDSARWDDYWAEVRQTGAHGDVLWDSDSPREAERYVRKLRQHSDISLPVVDVGCGNGRLTRILAGLYPFALGVDLAPNAIMRAAEESAGVGNCAFRTVDMTLPGAGRHLAAELGEVNVFVRGVFHVLDPSARIAMAGNLRDLLGARGTLVLAETNFRGSPLDYLEQLGATPTWIPLPLERAISAGIPRPSCFGEAELAECFDPNQWLLLAAETTGIETVPMGRPTGGTVEGETLPGYLAVLRTRQGRSSDPPARSGV